MNKSTEVTRTVEREFDLATKDGTVKITVYSDKSLKIGDGSTLGNIALNREEFINMLREAFGEEWVERLLSEDTQGNSSGDSQMKKSTQNEAELKQSLIERLKAEKKQEKELFLLAGIQRGRHDAYTIVPLDDFQHFEDESVIPEDVEYSEFCECLKKLETYKIYCVAFKQQNPTQSFDYTMRLGNHDFMKGWYTGIQEVWDEIRTEIV